MRSIWAKLGAQRQASWQICVLSLTLTPACLGTSASGNLAWSLREPQRRGRGFLFREVRGQPVGVESKRQILDTAQRENCLEFSMESLSGFFSYPLSSRTGLSIQLDWRDMYRHTLYYCTLLNFIDVTFITIWRFVAPLHQASLSVPFSHNIFSFHVFASHIDNSCNISSFFFIVLFVTEICDQ